MGFFSRLFGRQQPTQPRFPEAAERDYTLEDLSECDGKDTSKPLLLAVRGFVYDVGRGRDYYGPNGPYAMFAGKDCTRALAKMAFDSALFTGDTEGLDSEELERLADWIETFDAKYRKVGRLIQSA